MRMSALTHLISVRFSAVQGSYVIHGLGNDQQWKPLVVARYQDARQIIQDLRKVQTLQVICFANYPVAVR